jgi:hypothetical protein
MKRCAPSSDSAVAASRGRFESKGLVTEQPFGNDAPITLSPHRSLQGSIMDSLRELAGNLEPAFGSQTTEIQVPDKIDVNVN